MNKAAKIAILAVFLGFIGLFFILNIALPDVEFSQQENRYLRQVPPFTLKALFSGDFTEEFETYTTDQFAFRDAWTTLKARCELLSGKKENNGVYYCGNGVLINRFTAPEDEVIDQNMDYINSLADSVSIPVYFGLIPGAAEIQSSLLPEKAPCDSQQAVIDRAYSRADLPTVDIASVLRDHAEEYIFYHTDHHWTSLGAYYGYEALCSAMGLPAPSLSDYERRTVTEEFYGTIYSASGFSWVEPDEMETFVPDTGSVTVTDYSGATITHKPMYETSALTVKDKYSMFLGGNTPLISLETDNGGPRLLIVRDSYSDSLAPFLTKNFSRIDLVDLRYFHQSLANYIGENDFDAVLVLYSVDNFSTDQNLFMLKPYLMEVP